MKLEIRRRTDGKAIQINWIFTWLKGTIDILRGESGRAKIIGFYAFGRRVTINNEAEHV